MKQTSLNLDYYLAAEPCLGRLVIVWALYGVGMALLWRLAGPGLWSHAAVWALASLLALRLAAQTGEV
ncbi:MAG TPA: hypothetical protein VGX91_05590 [Candidatus Cybelea sp.]|jgi:hypothetical protein|nr:hypothetical protein [Candidatus Cybelea sp.]